MFFEEEPASSSQPNEAHIDDVQVRAVSVGNSGIRCRWREEVASLISIGGGRNLQVAAVGSTDQPCKLLLVTSRQHLWFLLPPFQIISHSKNLRKSKHLKFDQNHSENYKDL